MKPKTLNERVLEAKALAKLAKISKRDKHGRVSVVRVPGSNATINRVIVRRFDGGRISCECHKETSVGHIPCQGNLKGFCRHSLAAIIVALEDTGYSPRFRKEEVVAQKYVESHSEICYDRVWPLFSAQGKHGKLFMVAVDKTALELAK